MNENQRKQLIHPTYDTVAPGYDRSALRFFHDSATHLVKQLQLAGEEVFIRSEGNTLVLIPKSASRWRHVHACAGKLRGDIERNQVDGFDTRDW